MCVKLLKLKGFNKRTTVTTVATVAAVTTAGAAAPCNNNVLSDIVENGILNIAITGSKSVFASSDTCY